MNFLNLTEEEKKEYARKKKILYDFQILANKSIRFNGVRVMAPFFEAFTFKEMLQDDFIELFTVFGSNRKREDFNDYEIFNIITMNSSLTYVELILINISKLIGMEDNCFSNFSLDDAKEFIIEVFNKIECVFPCESSLNVSNVFYSLRDIFAKLSKYSGKDDSEINYEFLKVFLENFKFNTRTSALIFKAADNIIASSKNVENISSLLTLLKPYDYRNAPLVIVNENLSKEERIKIIKANYRLKDLPKYIHFIESKCTDLSLIDDFIEATVIQNNRVKEKNAGIVNIFKYLFGEKSKSFERYRNSRDFISKYNKYIMNEEFLKEMVSAFGIRNYCSLSSILFKFLKDEPCVNVLNVLYKIPAPAFKTRTIVMLVLASKFYYNAEIADYEDAKRFIAELAKQVTDSTR